MSERSSLVSFAILPRTNDKLFFFCSQHMCFWLVGSKFLTDRGLSDGALCSLDVVVEGNDKENKSTR